MDLISIAVLLVLGFLLVRDSQISASVVAGGGVASLGLDLGNTYTRIGPTSDPHTWYQGIKPGTVTLGGSPAPNSWQPGNVAQTSLTLASTGLAATEGIGMAVGATAQGGALAAGTTLGTAIPVIGVGIAVVGVVLGMISAHHKAALAAEGKALNDAEPRAMNAFVLVLQAVLLGEIADLATAEGHLDTILSDYFGEVKNIQRGTWPYTPENNKRDGFSGALDETYDNSWKKKHLPSLPGTCNAACVIGHYFIERGKLLVLAAVNDALGGNHGVLVLPAIPPHETQSGFPEVRTVY
jgi:hypothetical protein